MKEMIEMKEMKEKKEKERQKTKKQGQVGLCRLSNVRVTDQQTNRASKRSALAQLKGKE